MNSKPAVAQYMTIILADVADTLGWDSSSPAIVEASEEVALAIDLDTGDMRTKRAVARREAWKAAVSALTAFYDFRSDQEHFSRSQMLAGAERALAQAQSDCDALGVGESVMTMHGIDYVDDPYKASVDREEVA